ncbi:J domain-containing protein [Bradyrhizobium sp. CW7]|uniref:J domain-containing protein n=1 Tax=Bradyrhizobium sp. CW7 TaxID=2782688 RepID=UPI001FF9F970|nr:J domain-containing protein [Bradyrhizobium sp. CW7]MCK1354644.1 J domain-containing protein [Bradyrhizobium sp. CW7]
MPRKSKDGGAFELVAFAAVVIVVIVYFVFKLAVTIAVFGAPLIAFVSYFALAQNERPAIPKVEEYDNDGSRGKMLDLLSTRASLLQRRQELFAEGHEAGIDLTKGSDYQRFRENSGLGRRLNLEIDDTKSLIDRTEQSIDFVKRAVVLTFPCWELEVAAWIKRQSLAIAIKQAVLYVVPAFALGLLVPGRLHWLQSITLVDSSVNLGPLVFAVGAGYIAFVTHWFVAKDSLASTFEREPFEQWSDLRYRWSVDTHYDEFIPDGAQPHPSGDSFFDEDRAATDRAEDDHHEDPSEATPSWPEVLQVSRDAPIAEIKSAYRKQLKENHPDNVATLGSRIRAAAESQSKLINCAYEEARAERHF